MSFLLEHVTFGYVPGQTIVKDLNLEVPAGKVTGIAGPNGAGKSTLLKLMARVLKPDEGRIFLSDHPLGTIHRKAYARMVAWVPQELLLPFPLTVEDMVRLGRYPHLSPFAPFSKRDREAVDEALSQLELIRYRRTPVQNVSGGERKRVLLARALAADPEILLLDEPFTHLDPHHQRHMAEKILSLHGSGRTIIVVSHDVNLLFRVCQDIVLLKEGRMVEHLQGKGEFSRLQAWEDLFDCPFDRADGLTGPLIAPRVDGSEAP
ncbi:MAG TPA: ABC transporter ATP-binding protein [Thermoanaerobaculia bacterium]|nr:ABC transporter ATP-binding protein [Thermoanaerobaculia bacterium]HUM29736.1 ABC transporter ATP-binding protein [Thermoanaerobaculia bacterium]HXK67036.1 ABC transporter ATP-binding protein [Thermoanaerobaculia bacterium]